MALSFWLLATGSVAGALLLGWMALRSRSVLPATLALVALIGTIASVWTGHEDVAVVALLGNGIGALLQALGAFTERLLSDCAQHRE